MSSNTILLPFDTTPSASQALSYSLEMIAHTAWSLEVVFFDKEAQSGFADTLFRNSKIFQQMELCFNQQLDQHMGNIPSSVQDRVRWGNRISGHSHLFEYLETCAPQLVVRGVEHTPFDRPLLSASTHWRDQQLSIPQLLITPRTQAIRPQQVLCIDREPTHSVQETRLRKIAERIGAQPLKVVVSESQKDAAEPSPASAGTSGQDQPFEYLLANWNQSIYLTSAEDLETALSSYLDTYRPGAVILTLPTQDAQCLQTTAAGFDQVLQ